ncbi:reverse transcriptase-like protein [Candidatus Parcubacteria bacterium]|nr:MAG: reverse transcriptase-like protein [Candidatus Parcubacteria bacterium]
MSYRLFTDGGARGNPGPAAIGGVLYQDDKLIKNFHKYIGRATNNQAEYQAILFGLEMASKNNISELECYLDSELVVEQLNQRYKVKDKELAKIFVKVWNLTLSFKKISFSHVRREQNKEADALVNKALDEL